MSTSIPLEWLSFGQPMDDLVELQIGSNIHPATYRMAQEAAKGLWTLLPGKEELRQLSKWGSSDSEDDDHPAHHAFTLLRLADDIQLFANTPGGGCYQITEASPQVTLYARPFEIAKWAHFTILFAYLTRRQLKSWNPAVDFRAFRLFCLRWGLADVVGVIPEEEGLHIMTAALQGRPGQCSDDEEDELWCTVETKVHEHVFACCDTSDGAESDEEDYGEWLEDGEGESDAEDMTIKIAELSIFCRENLPKTPCHVEEEDEEEHQSDCRWVHDSPPPERLVQS